MSTIFDVNSISLSSFWEATHTVFLVMRFCQIQKNVWDHRFRCMAHNPQVHYFYLSLLLSIFTQNLFSVSSSVSISLCVRHSACVLTHTHSSFKRILRIEVKNIESEAKLPQFLYQLSWLIANKIANNNFVTTSVPQFPQKMGIVIEPNLIVCWINHVKHFKEFLAHKK